MAMRACWAAASNFRAGFYSALAGFVEPGETIEEAVRRELHGGSSASKTGRGDLLCDTALAVPVLIDDWLLRGGLRARDAKADDVEIAEVRWIERSVARELIEGKPVDGVRVPPPIAIAHHLIRAWALGAR
jgi:NAD+ diphosphatase